MNFFKQLITKLYYDQILNNLIRPQKFLQKFIQSFPDFITTSGTTEHQSQRQYPEQTFLEDFHKTHEESITLEFKKMDKFIKFLMCYGTIIVVIFLILAICFWIKIGGSWISYETKPVKLRSKNRQVPTLANIESSQEIDLAFDHRDTDVKQACKDFQPKIAKMADNLQNQVEQEFAALKSHIDQKQQELEKNHLRPHEHKAYKCAAACTANNKTSTLETRECVTNCMSPLERIQRMFQNRTNSVNQVIQNCMASCEGEVRTAVGDNPSDREMENARKVYMNCTLKCPTEAQPKIREAFDMLKNDIKNAGL